MRWFWDSKDKEAGIYPLAVSSENHDGEEKADTVTRWEKNTEVSYESALIISEIRAIGLIVGAYFGGIENHASDNSYLKSYILLCLLKTLPTFASISLTFPNKIIRFLVRRFQTVAYVVNVFLNISFPSVLRLVIFLSASKSLS